MNEAIATKEGEWTRWDYPHGETVWQRECPNCERGLLLAPARFCPHCDGSGYLVSMSPPLSEAERIEARG